jgi:hypothetical protein
VQRVHQATRSAISTRRRQFLAKKDTYYGVFFCAAPRDNVLIKVACHLVIVSVFRVGDFRQTRH